MCHCVLKIFSLSSFFFKTFSSNNTKTFPLLFLLAASSRAVLVQITPVLGVLVGVVVTLILIAICIVIFVKIKNKVRGAFNPFFFQPPHMLPSS
jgi:hypothetical protein